MVAMTTALVIIDVQDAILGGMPPDRQKEIDAAYDRMVARLQHVQQSARQAGVPVILVEHEGEGAIRPEIAAAAGEPVIRKTNCDAFFETDLAELLRRRQATRLVIGGCQTQYCIDTTCRRAVSLGYDVTLLADGHMTTDMGRLTYDQIIAHHNAVLAGFHAGPHAIELRQAADMIFQAQAGPSSATCDSPPVSP